MAENKPFKKVAVNTGPRTYHLRPVDSGKKDKDGKPILQERFLGPGSSIEMLDDAEWNHISQYRDIKDADKYVPGGDGRVAQLEKEREELKARIAELEELVQAPGGPGKKSKDK